MLRRTGWLAGAIVLCALGTARDARAQQLRFSTTAAGGIAATGNTLGLSKQVDANGPGTEDSIGTFLTLAPQSVDNVPLNAANPWPLGTTNDWTQNGSSGVLSLPSGATVLYAELVWAGSYDYGEQPPVIGNLNDPVTLGFGAATTQVTPSNQTAVTIDQPSSDGLFEAHYYIRSADVTAFVLQHGAGSYAVEGVPGTETTTIDTLSAAGWSLLVAYHGEDQPIRNLSIFVGGSFVDENSTQDYQFSGFCAPPFGPVEGDIVVSALEGDADITGDVLMISEADTGPFVTLSGPNNPEQNFFCSQLNDKSGNLDTQGTFGISNHDAIAGVNVSGGRQGWDLTTVTVSDLEGHLVNDQTEAVIRTSTSGDSYVPTAVAFEIDVKSPDFQGSTAEALPASVMIGDVITYTATLSNSGEAVGTDVLFSLPLDAGLDLLTYRTDGMNGDVDGDPVAESDLATGVEVGDLEVNDSRTIEMTFEVVGAPANGSSFVLSGSWAHIFVTCDSDPPLEETYSPPTVTVAYATDPGSGGMGGAGGMTSASGGDDGSGGAGNSDSGAGGNGQSDDPTEDGGCGCETPGGARDGAAWWLLAGLGLIAARRRRRP